MLCGNPSDHCLHLREVSQVLGISRRTALEWFMAAEGVIVLREKPLNARRESRVHIRVPRKVMERVRAEHEVKLGKVRKLA